MIEKLANRTRITAYTAVFGALWGLSEISLGAVLHSFHFPLTGMVMSAVSVIIALTGALFINRRGAILVMGLIAAFMKFFSIGGILITPVIAILIESAIMEICLWIGKRKLLSLCAAGGIVVIYTFMHKIFTGIYLYGFDLIKVFKNMMFMLCDDFNIKQTWGWLLILTLIAIHLLTGIFSGVTAWWLSRKIKIRLDYENK